MYLSVIPRVYNGPLTFAVGHIEGYPNNFTNPLNQYCVVQEFQLGWNMCNRTSAQ